MADAHKNFAYSTVLTAPSPALSGVTLVLQTGAGANFPTPPFNATVWPSGSLPLVSNAEIVRVTAISTDTLTIVRSQESSSARTIVVGDQVSAGITVKTLTDVEAAINPSGSVMPYAGITVPNSNWLLCNGQAISRTTYATLFNLFVPQLGTTTMTIATPAVVSFTAHGLQNGDTVFFTTTGALPTGVTANTIYYITVVDANSFKLSTTTGGVGTIFVNTSGTQSGTHTLWRCLYGLGDGSTTFNVPDLRGRVPAGVENMGGAGNATRLTGFANAPPNPLAIGNAGGLETHTLTTAQIPAHSHPMPTRSVYSATGAAQAFDPNGTVNSATQNNTGGDGAHNNVQPTILMNYIVKT